MTFICIISDTLYIDYYKKPKKVQNKKIDKKKSIASQKYHVCVNVCSGGKQ